MSECCDVVLCRVCVSECRDLVLCRVCVSECGIVSGMRE